MCVGVHTITSLKSSDISWIVCEIRDNWLYSCDFEGYWLLKKNSLPDYLRMVGSRRGGFTHFLRVWVRNETQTASSGFWTWIIDSISYYANHTWIAYLSIIFRRVTYRSWVKGYTAEAKAWEEWKSSGRSLVGSRQSGGICEIQIRGSWNWDFKKGKKKTESNHRLKYELWLIVSFAMCAHH